MNNFETWLRTFLEEKEIDLECAIEIEGPRTGLNIVPIGVIVEYAIESQPVHQKQIQDVLVQIDFYNGDVMHFLEHLARGVVLQREYNIYGLDPVEEHIAHG